MFPCLLDDRYWPLTASVGFFRAPPEKVADVVVPWGRESLWVRAEHDTLDRALEAHAPYGSIETMFILSSGNGSWTTVLNSQYPVADVTFYLAARAHLDLGCELVAVCWQPASPRAFASAEFLHQRRSPRLFRSRRGDLRAVQASDQGGRWQFDTSGEPRAFEEPTFYERRRIAERLPRELLARYVAAVGVAVDDPSWWDGSVVVAAMSKRTRLPYEAAVEAERSWSTTEELRRLCGYPLDKIPDDLVRFKSAR